MCISVGSRFLIGVMIAITWIQLRAEASDQMDRAGSDAQGHIYVSSDSGTRIVVGNTARCSMTSEAPNRETMACLVKEDSQGTNPMPSHKLEIYSRGGVKQTIEPGAPIREWHFWELGKDVAVFSGEPGNKGMYGLYDSANGSLVVQVAEPADERLLPQWAKSQFEIEMESVPSGPQYSRERTAWIAKTLYQIGKLQPGMRRKDVLKLLTEEGGLSTRFQRTYVDRECPYIKVDVRFKVVNDGDPGKEDPEDVIESISRPYLAWSYMD